jgi:phage baseplate assembly protein W
MSIVRRYNPIDLLPDVAVGIKLPFTGKNGNLFDLSYSTHDQAISNLKNLLLTRRGERIMEPYFGTTIQDSLFEPNTESLIDLVRNSITEAITFWLPYIIINSLDVENVIASLGNQQEHGVQITLNVSVTENGANVPITFLVTPSTITVL